MDNGEPIARQRDKAATREQILTAATRLLAQDGYAALRVAGVAKEAGVSLGGYLHHFPSKELLVIAVLERLSLHVLALARHDAAKAVEGGDTLQLIADSAKRFYQAPEFLIYLDIHLSARRHTLIGEKAVEIIIGQRVAIEALWLPLLEREGVTSHSALNMIRAIWALARGLAISSTSRDADQLDDQVSALVLRALRVPYHDE